MVQSADVETDWVLPWQLNVKTEKEKKLTGNEERRGEVAEAVTSHPKARNTPNICSIDFQGFDTTSEIFPLGNDTKEIYLKEGFFLADTVNIYIYIFFFFFFFEIVNRIIVN